MPIWSVSVVSFETIITHVTTANIKIKSVSIIPPEDFLMLFCIPCALWEVQGFPGGSDGKESICNTGDLGSIPRLGRSLGEGNGYPLQYYGLENSTDSRARQATYSSWSCKESDMTERLSLSLSTIRSPRQSLVGFLSLYIGFASSRVS